MKPESQTKGFAAELGLMFRRARQAWGLVPRVHKWALAGAALVMACTSACSTALPLLLGRLVDEVQQGAAQGLSREALFRVAAWFLGLIGVAYLTREALHVLRRYLVERTCTRISQDMSVHLVAHMMTVDLATVTRERVGALHGRILRSVDGLVRLLRMSFLDFFPVLAGGLFALAAALAKQPLLGLVMVGVIPVAVFLTVRQLISQKEVRLKLLRHCEEIDGAVVEQLTGLESIRAANTEPLEIQRLARTTAQRRALEIRHHFTMSLFGCAKALNEGLFHIVVLGGAIYLALTGVNSFGDILTFSILFLNVMTPLTEVHRVLDEGHESSLRVGDLLDMLAEPVDPSFATVSTRQPHLQPGAPVLVIDNLRAEYTTHDGQRIRAVNGISLTIRHGETIGVAGRSGSGKSTWLKVLLRLTHPCGGTVQVGGAPLDQLSREEIGRLIAYVGQVPFVFAGTIAENIAYGQEEASLHAIRWAAEMAHLHEEILALPGGYQALVAERGQNLSGGQRQRLALARVLLQQRPILILDEATAALDNISERHVQRALGVTNAARTTVLVAHRLSTLRDADRILVFDEGRIVETGTYDQLLGRGGVFTELVLSAENGIKGPSSPKGAEPAPDVAAGLCA